MVWTVIFGMQSKITKALKLKFEVIDWCRVWGWGLKLMCEVEAQSQILKLIKAAVLVWSLNQTLQFEENSLIWSLELNFEDEIWI